MVVVTKTRFSQLGWADPSAGVEQWSHTCDSSAAWPGDLALLLHVQWLWCTPDPAQAPTLRTGAESNLFALPQRSTSFKFRFLNDSLSEWIFFFQKDLKAWLWDITKQKAVFFWLCVLLVSGLTWRIVSYLHTACLMAFNLHCDNVRKHSD